MKTTLLIAAIVAVSNGAFAQTPAIPRTVDGRPDFQGVWMSGSLTPVERIEGAKALVATDEEARTLAAGAYVKARSREQEINVDPEGLSADLKELARVNGQWRTSQVVDPSDGKIPRTVEGKRRFDEATQRRKELANDPEARGLWERCIAGLGRAPLMAEPSFSLRSIVQTSSDLVIYTEQGGDPRIIGIGAEHRPPALTSVLGDSIAWWEGDVLVIETLHQRAEPYRPETRVVERLSLPSPDEVDYQYTVQDEVLFQRPWTAEFSLHRSRLPMYEYACSEGNYGLANILQAAREADKRSAASMAKSKQAARR